MDLLSATRRAASLLAIAVMLSSASAAQAQLAVGNWIRTDPAGKGITLKVEACCNGGLRLTYKVPTAPDQPPATLTVESPLDGTEAPLLTNGKPLGETMAIRRVDASHYQGFMKTNGKLSVTSTSEVAADGKSAKSEAVMHMPDGKTQKVIETWVRQ